MLILRNTGRDGIFHSTLCLDTLEPTAAELAVKIAVRIRSLIDGKSQPSNTVCLDRKQAMRLHLELGNWLEKHKETAAGEFLDTEGEL